MRPPLSGRSGPRGQTTQTRSRCPCAQTSPTLGARARRSRDIAPRYIRLGRAQPNPCRDAIYLLQVFGRRAIPAISDPRRGGSRCGQGPDAGAVRPPADPRGRAGDDLRRLGGPTEPDSNCPVDPDRVAEHSDLTTRAHRRGWSKLPLSRQFEARPTGFEPVTFGFVDRPPVLGRRGHPRPSAIVLGSNASSDTVGRIRTRVNRVRQVRTGRIGR
jgi:hypothetical protein